MVNSKVVILSLAILLSSFNIQAQKGSKLSQKTIINEIDNYLHKHIDNYSVIKNYSAREKSSQSDFIGVDTIYKIGQKSVLARIYLRYSDYYMNFLISQDYKKIFLLASGKKDVLEYSRKGTDSLCLYEQNFLAGLSDKDYDEFLLKIIVPARVNLYQFNSHYNILSGNKDYVLKRQMLDSIKSKMNLKEGYLLSYENLYLLFQLERGKDQIPLIKVIDIKAESFYSSFSDFLDYYYDNNVGIYPIWKNKDL